MPESAHLLVVRAAGVLWGLPMDAVEQTFDLASMHIHQVGADRVVVHRGAALEVVDLAAVLGYGEAPRSAGVIVWAAGRRRVFAVDEPIGQVVHDRVDVPRMARGPHSSGIVITATGETIPIIEPGAVVGAWSVGDAEALGFSDMQRSALLEIANIGSGHAATALSSLLGRAVEIGYSEALLTVLGEAIDRIGAPMERSALVNTPVAEDGGAVLLVFPDQSAQQLCELLGTSLDDAMGRSALQEIGNILATSYLNAIVEMTGMELEPEPPSVEVDLLGELIAQSGANTGAPGDPTVLMRSRLTVEACDAAFSFLFVPRVANVHGLLDRLGLATDGRTAAAADADAA
jgi:chemotaxis protein CheC